MILERVFDTLEHAESAKEILEEGGIIAVVSEDKFEGVPIQKFNVPARYRLFVEDRDFPKTTKFLAEKLRIRS